MTTLRRTIRSLGVLLSITALTATVATMTTSAATGATAKPPIKIGTTIWNYPSIPLDAYFPGIKAAIRAINKSGGINGRKIEWISCEGADANGLENCAREMISDGVVATISDAAVIDEVAFGQILATAGIPQIDPFVSAPQSLDNPNDYLLSVPNPVRFSAITAFMKLRHLKTYHVIAGVSSTANQIIAAVEQSGAYYGVQQQGSATEVPLTAADFTPFIADAATAGADVNISLLGQTMLVTLLQDLQTYPKKLVFGFNAAAYTAPQFAKFGQSSGPLTGALLVDDLPPLSAAKQYPAIGVYQRELTAEYKAGDSLASPSQVTPAAMHSWLDTQVLAEVMRGLKTVTASTVKHGLNKAKNLSLLGLKPPWTPSHRGPAGFERVSSPWVYLSTVKNGKPVLFQTKPINGLLPFEK